MIKLVCVLEKKAGISDKDFHDYWLNSHGPRVREHMKKLKARRYVQSHLIDHPENEAGRALRGMLPPAPGVTEIWWDSIEDYEAALASEAGREAFADIASDERNFLDQANTQAFFTEEHVIFDHSAARIPLEKAIKIVYILNRRSDLTHDECMRTWLDDHGPLLRKFAARLPNRVKYVQAHTLQNEVNSALAARRGLAAPPDGVTTVWWDPDASVPEDLANEALAVMAADEARFVDLSRSRRFFTKEHLIFG